MTKIVTFPKYPKPNKKAAFEKAAAINPITYEIGYESYSTDQQDNNDLPLIKDFCFFHNNIPGRGQQR